MFGADCEPADLYAEHAIEIPMKRNMMAKIDFMMNMMP